MGSRVRGRTPKPRDSETRHGAETRRTSLVPAVRRVEAGEVPDVGADEAPPVTPGSGPSGVAVPVVAVDVGLPAGRAVLAVIALGAGTRAEAPPQVGGREVVVTPVTVMTVTRPRSTRVGPGPVTSLFLPLRSGVPLCPVTRFRSRTFRHIRDESVKDSHVETISRGSRDPESKEKVFYGTS